MYFPMNGMVYFLIFHFRLFFLGTVFEWVEDKLLQSRHVFAVRHLQIAQIQSALRGIFSLRLLEPHR